MSNMIRLERWATVQDANGNNIESMDSAFNVFAHVRRTGGRSGEKHGIVRDEDSLLVRMRWNPSMHIDHRWKLVYAGKRYTIKSVEYEDEKKFYLLIEAIK